MKSGPRGFVGGEVSEHLYGRPDDPRYNLGAELLRNFIVTPTGVAAKRPGTEFVRETRNSAPARLFTFRASSGHDIWVEVGLRTEYPATSAIATYARFHSQGGTQLHSRPWDNATAYLVGDPVLSGGVLYWCVLAHTGQAPPNATYWLSRAYSGSTTYAVGAVVSSAGVVYYCRIQHSGVALSTETHWYAMPTSGEYEIPTPLGSPNRDALFFQAQTSMQSLALSFASVHGLPSELRPNDLGWIWPTVTFSPTLLAPTSVLATATKKGNAQAIDEIATVFGSVRIVTKSKMNIGTGEIVYAEGSPFAPLNNKYWRVGIVSSSSAQDIFFLDDPETGLPFQDPVAFPLTGGTVRVTRLNAAEQNTYVVTAVDSTGRESQASVTSTAINNLFVSGSYNTITWAAVPGATRYRVYKQQDGTSLYGLIGQTEGLTFRDDAIAPALGEPPPILDTSLNGLFPRAVAHFEGRRWYASPSAERSQDIWGTKTNTESDLTYAIPLRATDRIQQRLKARLGCNILHIVPMAEMIVLTDTTEFRITSPNSDALTPESFVARPQSYVGASRTQPEIMGNVLLFAAARGGHIMQFGYSAEAGGYFPDSICLRAQHLFDGFQIYQLSAQRAPVPILWVTRSDGTLLGCTFVPGQQVLAWQQFVTQGMVESCVAGLDDGDERVMMVVQRSIDGQTKRFIERLQVQDPVPWAESWHVDCGLRYDGALVSTVAGLQHLEGEEVAVFADGLVQSRKVVVGGQITLDAPASMVLVGLPFRATAKTVPATFAVEAFGSGKPKSVTAVWVRVTRSGQFAVGISEDDLMPADVPAGEFFSGQTEIRVPDMWTHDGQLVIDSQDPVPLQVVSYTAKIEVGG